MTQFCGLKKDWLWVNDDIHGMGKGTETIFTKRPWTGQ
jgi:hypothetical protein